MKGNLKRPRIIDDCAPVDSIEVVDRSDLEDFRKEMWVMHRDYSDYIDRQVERLENKIKTMGIVGSAVAAALCFVMIMRKDD